MARPPAGDSFWTASAVPEKKGSHLETAPERFDAHVSWPQAGCGVAKPHALMKPTDGAPNIARPQQFGGWSGEHSQSRLAREGPCRG